jgi:hypothetical protein
MEKCGEAAFSGDGKAPADIFGPEKAGRRKLPPRTGREFGHVGLELAVPRCTDLSGGLRLAVLLGTAMAVSHEVAEGCVAGICTAISPLSPGLLT